MARLPDRRLHWSLHSHRGCAGNQRVTLHGRGWPASAIRIQFGTAWSRRLGKAVPVKLPVAEPELISAGHAACETPGIVASEPDRFLHHSEIEFPFSLLEGKEP